MAKKHGSRRRGGRGFGMGRLLSTKNLIYTGGAVIGAAMLAPNVDSRIAGAVGGLMGAGPIGAIAGYFTAPTVKSVAGGLIGTGGAAQGGIVLNG